MLKLLQDVVEKHYHVDPILVQDAICDFQELRYVMKIKYFIIII